MTHINPGTDTTINPVIINDTYREKQHSSEQPKEYIITDKMIKAWRNECVKGIQIKFDDSRCLGCEFCGTGARYHCCDFDDVDVEQMFRSRPHPAPAQDQKAPICENCGLDSATCRMDMAGCLQAQNAAARKAREELQPFVDLVKIMETKNREMADLMRRNGMKIDNLQDPMQKLAFTFYSEIAEMAHKADVVIKEHEESLRQQAGEQHE